MTSPVIPQMVEALTAKIIDAIDGFPAPAADREAIAQRVAENVANYRAVDDSDD